MHVLQLLGKVSVGVPPGAVSRQLSRPRSVSILAYLAAADVGGVTRDRLAAIVWEEADRSHARHSLANQLHVLRTGLGSEAILTSGEFVSLNPEMVTADVTEFKRALRDRDLERAGELYSGPFLDGFHLDGSWEFERWADDERRVLATQAQGVFEQLAERAESDGEPAATMKWLQRAVQHDPYNSRAALELARAMAALRDPGNAVQMLQQHAAKLRRDLGVDPDPEVLELVQTGDFGLEPGHAWDNENLETGVRKRDQAPAGVTKPRSRSNDAVVGVHGPGGSPDSRLRRTLARMAAAVAAIALITVAVALAGRAGAGEESGSGLLVVLPVQPIDVEVGVAELVTEHLRSELADWETPTVVHRQDIDAWWQGVGGTSDVLPAGIGRRLGSDIAVGTVLAPSVQRSGNGIQVSASLVDVRSGAVLAAARAAGPLDSLGHVAHWLTAQLLAEQADVPADRISILRGHDPAAVRLFIRAHPHDSDVRDRLLREAVEQDSTFALAALEILESSGDYINLELGGAWEESASIVWVNRHRLSPADRVYTEALLGWRFNENHTAKIHVATWERAVETAPDRIAHWQGLFRECYRWCSEIRRSWRESLLDVHDMLIARGDSSFLERATELAFAGNDSVRLRSYSRMLPADAWYGRWLVAVGLGREKERAQLVERFPTIGNWALMRIGNAAIMTGTGLEDAEVAAAFHESSQPGSIYSLRRMVLARERGRHAEYRQLRDKLFQYFDVRTDTDALAAANVIFEWGFLDEPETDGTLDTMDAMLSDIVSGPRERSADTVSVAHCYRAQLRLLRQDTTGVGAAIRFLTGDPTARSLAISRICVPFIELLRARRMDREAHLEAAQVLFNVVGERPLRLGLGPGMFVVEANLAASANLELARSLGELGYPEIGFQVAVRRPYQASLWGLYGFHVDFVRQEAHLLAQAGERQAALARYDKYFELRPEPPDLESWAQVWETARGEQAAMLAAEVD